MGIKALDLSNWSGTLTPELVAHLKEDGYGLLILQAVDPESPSAPPSKFLSQVDVCEQSKMSWQPYIYDYLAADEWMARCLALLDQAAGRGWLPSVWTILGVDVAGWLDTEDLSAAAQAMSVGQRVVAMRAHLASYDDWMAVHRRPRVGDYSGRWYFERYLPGVTEFSDRPLWDGHFDGDGTTHAFTPYGGWSACAIKQFVGTSDVDGLTRVDQDVLAEGASIHMVDTSGLPAVPDAYTQHGWNDWWTVAVNVQGIADALGAQLASAQQQLAEVQAQLTQAQQDRAESNRLVGLAEQRAADHTAQLALLQEIAAKLGIAVEGA